MGRNNSIMTLAVEKVVLFVRTNTCTFIMEIQCKSRTEVSLNFRIHFGKHHQRQRGEERDRYL